MFTLFLLFCRQVWRATDKNPSKNTKEEDGKSQESEEHEEYDAVAIKLFGPSDDGGLKMSDRREIQILLKLKNKHTHVTGILGTGICYRGE